MGRFKYKVFTVELTERISNANVYSIKKTSNNETVVANRVFKDDKQVREYIDCVYL